jgi:hypothetical protein
MYSIIINDSEYLIKSSDKYNNLLTNFIKYVMLNKSYKLTTNKFNIIFKNNTSNYYFSLTAREHIMDLLDEIKE